MTVNPTNSQLSKDANEQKITVMLAEYTLLQERRRDYIGYGENRLRFLLTVIAGVTAGIGLINQWVKPNELANWISSFIYIALLLFGLLSFFRTANRSTRIRVFTMGERRVRHFFFQMYPDLHPFFIEPFTDDMKKQPDWAILFYDIAGMMSLVNAFLACIGVLLLFTMVWLVPTLWSVPSALIIAIAFYFVQNWYYRKEVNKTFAKHSPNFPS